jgi:hypothetical protein
VRRGGRLALEKVPVLRDGSRQDREADLAVIDRTVA